MKKEAEFYKSEEGGKVQCLLCPHNCVISPGKTGICGVRINEGGKLFTTIYGEVTSVAMDPIEKKPLYHFHPGSGILSIGTRGCNLKCPYCQNWQISQDVNARTNFFKPEEIIGMAVKNRSIGIAYTYSEPMIWFEYVMDCSKLAKGKGLKNVLVTNGYINREPLEKLLEYTDAMNIDLKTFREDTYKKVQKGGLSDVLETIRFSAEKCHVELTTLIVTGINDTMAEMDDIIGWISGLDKNIPWHISRYHPNYKHDAAATDIDFLLEVCDRAAKKLNYVYCGNISGSYGRSSTICPSCGAALINRAGYITRLASLKDGKCSKCGFVPGIVQ
jgi:pyruvate formate lyase activating enzyme